MVEGMKGSCSIHFSCALKGGHSVCYDAFLSNQLLSVPLLPSSLRTWFYGIAASILHCIFRPSLPHTPPVPLLCCPTPQVLVLRHSCLHPPLSRPPLRVLDPLSTLPHAREVGGQRVVWRSTAHRLVSLLLLPPLQHVHWLLANWLTISSSRSEYGSGSEGLKCSSPRLASTSASSSTCSSAPL